MAGAGKACLESGLVFLPIDFCPFCGQKLPPIRMKDPLPEPVMTMDDGGYYCSTCHERLHCCECRPPEEMWEVDR